MRKFIFKIFLYVFCVSFLIIGINEWYKGRDLDKDYTKKFETLPSNIQVCNFGSSHGLYGFCYEDYEKQYVCFNFGLESQMLSYDLRILENYKDNIQEGAIVFIPVSYFSLFGQKEEEAQDFGSKNKRYYKILPPELIKNYELDTDIYVRYFPVTSAYEEVFQAIVKKADHSEWEGKASDIDLEKNVSASSERHIITNKFDEYGNRIINQEEIDALVQIIKECKALGTRPILLITPFLSEYLEAVEMRDTDFYQNFYQVIDEIVNSTEVEFYDYSSDKRFKDNYDLFMNGDHLNEEGAKKFVDVLMKEVFIKEN